MPSTEVLGAQQEANKSEGAYDVSTIMAPLPKMATHLTNLPTNGLAQGHIAQ